MEIPEKYLKDGGDPSICEHCNMNRRRKRAFVLQSPTTGEFKQIGSTCIKDFTEGTSPNDIAKFWSFLEAIEEEAEGGRGFGYGGEWSVGLKDYLLHGMAVIRAFGYISKTKAWDDEEHCYTQKPTSQLVDNFMEMRAEGDDERLKQNKMDKLQVTSNDVEIVDTIIDWASNLSDEVCLGDEYRNNLRTIARLGIVNHKRMGYAISMIPAYEREHRKPDVVQDTEYYNGQVEDKITVEGVTVQSIREIQGKFGVTTIYNFTKGENLFVWFSGSGMRVKEGEVITIRGTIKRFNTFRDAKQTIITRVSNLTPRCKDCGEDLDPKDKIYTIVCKKCGGDV